MEWRMYNNPEELLSSLILQLRATEGEGLYKRGCQFTFLRTPCLGYRALTFGYRHHPPEAPPTTPWSRCQWASKNFSFVSLQHILLANTERMDEGCWLPCHQRSGKKNLHPPAWLVQVYSVIRLLSKLITNRTWCPGLHQSYYRITFTAQLYALYIGIYAR